MSTGSESCVLKDGAVSEITIEEPRIKKRKKKELSDIFFIIFCAALIIGIPILAPLRQVKRALSVSLEIFSLFLLCARTFLTTIECIYNGPFWPTPALRYCFIVHCLTGYVLLVILVVNQRKIISAIRKIKMLTSKLNPCIIDRTSSILIQLLLSTLLISALSTFSSRFFFLKAWDYYIERIKSMVPFSDDSVYYYYYDWIVVFSVVASYYFGTATHYVTLFLCANTYRSSERLFELYRGELRMMKDEHFSVDEALRCSALFRSIVSKVKEVDKVLGPCALTIFIAVVNNFFNLLSVVISSDNSFRSLEADAFSVLSTLSVSIIVLHLTESANLLVQQKIDMKEELLELSVSVIRQSPNCATASAFNNLIDNIYSAEVYMTGCGYFKIDKKIILTVISVLISYGVLMYQAGAT